jgi:hypothetical protein
MKRQAMNKIIEVLLFPFTELAGWLVMRDLRRWARSYRVETMRMTPVIDRFEEWLDDKRGNAP